MQQIQRNSLAHQQGLCGPFESGNHCTFHHDFAISNMRIECDLGVQRRECIANHLQASDHTGLFGNQPSGLPLIGLDHKGRFERADSGVTKPVAARGVAFGDINNDGSMDAVMSCLGGPPILLLNRGGENNHWLSISLQGTRSNRDGYGARVSVNGQTRVATSTGSYLCANDKRLHFGLGAAEKATIEILWPSGVKQILNNVSADQFLAVREPERS